MGFQPVGVGITKLSELEIDAAPGKAKDINELILTAQGDMLYRNAEAAGLPGDYGIGYNFLHMANTGQLTPEWYDIIDLIAYLTGAVNRVIALPTLAIPIPDLSVVAAQASSPPGKTATPSLTIPVPTVEEATATYTPGAVDGAIADDGGDQTDETTEANEATADDMTLLPGTPAVDDAYYFGLDSPWDWLCLNISTAGAGTWTIKWEYWNGSTWPELPSGYYDTSNGFRNGGKQSVSFVRPGDWATSSILLMDLYWVRARVSAYSSVVTQPLGQQAWIGSH